MYDFVLHAFFFLGALFGCVLFGGGLLALFIVIAHEFMVAMTNSINNSNNTEDPS